MQHIRTIDLVKAHPQISPKKPVAIKLKDGTIISLSDLPPTSTKRWVASAKESVIRVYMAGLATRDDLILKYALSSEEFDIWLNRYLDGGKQALKVTKIQTL